MSRISRIALVLCGLLPMPVLGYWEYDETTRVIGGPGSGGGSYPDGSAAWSATAQGTVSPGMFQVTASGLAQGYASVVLVTWQHLGTQRSAYGNSRIEGTNSYHWVNDETNDREITVTIRTEIYSAHFNYGGRAINHVWTNPANATSRAYIQGGGSANGVGDFPQGYGYGYANSEGGSAAYNQYYGLQATDDYSWADQVNGDTGVYSGWLWVNGTADYGLYPTTPVGNQFSAMARVLGTAEARGQVTHAGPSYPGAFDATTSYYVSGMGRFTLTGDIRNLQ